ncbi:MAG: pitrilysin family protein [Bacteroidota bacterium]
MRIFSLLTLTALLAVFSPNTIQAQGVSAAAPNQEVVEDVAITEMSTVEGITEYRMAPNGLKILLFPDQSKPTITVNVTYKVGSRHEAYGETGMAHLLEHLVFKGTPDHPDIPQELTEHGARPNGTTWYDRTNYFETFAASQENLEWALDMEADRMVNSFIAAEDLESEMTVVRNEFERGENSPTGILMQRVLSTSYLWHNYGKSTIGSRADLENVPIERLQDFYRRWYHPDNAVLMVAGKIDKEETLELIKQTFGRIPAREHLNYPTYTREPTQDGERFVELRRTGDVQVVQAAYHVPAGTHPDHAAVSVLVELLTSEPSGRLYKALVEDGLATSQWGYTPALAEPGYAMFNADVLVENDLSAAEVAMKKVFDELGDNPPTEEEVNRAKESILNGFERFLRNTERVGTGISSYIAMGDWRMAFVSRDRIEAVTPDMVMQVAERYLKPSNRTVGRFLPTEDPDRAEIPEVNDLASMVEGYVGREAIAEGEAFDPTPDNIDDRAVDGQLGNGFKYNLLPKETRGNAVVASVSLRFGTLDALRGLGAAPDFAGDMLMMGSENYTRQEIEDRLEELKARVFLGGGADGAYAFIETENEKLVEVIDFVGEIFRNPTFPESEFETQRDETLAGLAEGKSDPRALGQTAMGRAANPLPSDHPDYETTFEEEEERVRTLTLDEVKDFYNKFYGANNGTFGASGDMDTEAVIAALERNFGSWNSPADYERIPDNYQDVDGEMIKIETPDKANAWFFVNQNLPIGQDHPDYPALMMGNFMLGGGFLNSRLATRIRQEEGLSYGVGSFYSGNSLDENGNWGAYAIYAPENREALEQAFREEIEKVQTDGFSAEELDAARNGWLQSQQVNRAQDNRMAGTMSNNAYLGRTMQWTEELENRMQELTVEQINAAMARHLDMDKMIFVRAGDFAKHEGDGSTRP